MFTHSNLVDILAWGIFFFGPFSLYSVGLLFRRGEKAGLVWNLAWLWTTASFTVFVSQTWINAYHSIEDVDNAPAVFALLFLFYVFAVFWFFLAYVMHAWAFLSYLCLIISAILAVIAASVAVLTFPEPHGWHYALYSLALGPIVCICVQAWESNHNPEAITDSDITRLKYEQQQQQQSLRIPPRLSVTGYDHLSYRS
jgi:hypothetical protein